MNNLHDMIAGIGPTLLRVSHDAGILTFRRGDPGVEFLPEKSLVEKLRSAFFARDGFALARAWLDSLKQVL